MLKLASASRQVLGSMVVVGLLATPAAAAFSEMRSIFVDRFDYTYNSGNIASMTAAIDNQMQRALDEGFTHVIWQVRGRGDALYDSNYEPPVSGLTPGFDPLQAALDSAHARGLKLHAWLNSTNLWNTNAINPPRGHIYHNNNPSFRLTDINGNIEPQSGWSNYSSVNPVLPEVHTHINNVVDDIATNYAVDGIHLDYIRYIPGGYNFDRFPHDPVSHDLFQQATGKDGSNPANFSAYKSYITGRITDLVASVKQTVDAREVDLGREIDLSASVWRDPNVGRNDYLQDYGTWIRDELLDVAMPMLYLDAGNDYLFDGNLQNTLNIRNGSGSNTLVSPTLAVYLHQQSGGGGVDLTLSQMERARQFGADGVGFYDYPAFFNTQSSAERQAIRDYFESLLPADPAPGNVIDDFEAGEGHFGWAYNVSPGSQTFGLSSETTIEHVLTEAQTGVGSQELRLIDAGDGPWQIRHNSGIGAGLNSDPAGNVSFPSTGWIGLWAKTADPGVSVEIALDDPSSAERGVAQSLVADDQWHLYQWNLEDAADWEGWVFGNGSINEPFVSIDSIFFSGDGDATIYLDNVSHNPDGPLMTASIAGDFNADGNVNAADLAIWAEGYGMMNDATPGHGDATGDGQVRGDDLLAWQRRGQGPLAAATHSVAIPEPAAAVLLLTAWACVGRKRRR